MFFPGARLIRAGRPFYNHTYDNMKLNKLLFVLLPLALLASCDKAAETAVPSGDGATTLKAGITATFTRTWLDSESGGTALRVYWSDGDRVNVNGQNSAPISVGDGQKVSDAEFLLRSVIPPYNVIYPAGIVTSDTYVDGAIPISIPTRQDYVSGSFGNGAAALYGYAATDEAPVSMKNLCAGVRVKLWGDSSILIDDAILTSSTTPVAGRYTLKPEDGTLTLVEGSNELSLNLGEGVALSPEGTWFYFTVPAGEYADSLVFTFIQKSDRRAMKCKWTPDEALKAGILYSFSNVEYLPGAKDIETPDDWNEFATCVNEGGDMRKWLRGGVVHLANDITADALNQVEEEFTWVFDGQGHTITRTDGNSALFSKVKGTVRDLNLEGDIFTDADVCASLTDYLYPGGLLTDCTNNANIDNASVSDVRAGGLVGVMYGGIIRDCTNSGRITGSAEAGDDTFNMQVAGIVAQICASDTNSGDALLENCVNTGAITAVPGVVDNTVGFNYNGVAGIAGWLRGQGHSFTLTNCDNSGTITYSADNVSNNLGAKAYSISVGGIVGLAGDVGSGMYPYYSGSNYIDVYGVFSSLDGGSGTYYPGTDAGIDATLTDCDNTGTVHNCGDNYSATSAVNNKVYTGGIAGSFVGTSDKYVSMTNCRNTGTLLPYDLTGDEASTRAFYCQVVGGLIGYGGYVDIKDCYVNCEIGNGKRQSYAMSPGIGNAMRPFKVDKCTLWATMKFVRLSANNTNSASVAVVPTKYNTTATTPVPSIGDAVIKSVISNTACGAKVFYTPSYPAAGSTDDFSSNCTSSTALNSGSSSIVRGKGFTAGTGLTFDSNTSLTSAPN